MNILQRLNLKKDKSLELSAPRSITLHGVKIHKLSVAKYVEWLKIADDLPEIICGCAFPDCDNLADMVNKIVELDRQAVLQLVGRLLTTVPTEICRLLSNLLDIEESRLLDVKSPNPLTLNQLADIIIAFVRVNDYSDFFDSVQQLLKTFHQKRNTNTQDTTGYNGG